jgi:hypothetical protein
MWIRNNTLPFFLCFLFAGVITWVQADPPTVLYHLQPGSSYEQGCYNDCMCPILQAPLVGTFGLEILPSGAPFDRYRVEPVNFSVPALNKTFTGSGIYDVLGEFNELVLDLQDTGGQVQQFSSGGFVPSGAQFPNIDIVVSVNQFQGCFDYSLHLVASPAEPPWLTVAADELAWTQVVGAGPYDIVCGNLDYLRATAGNFSGAVDLCMQSDYAQTSLDYDLTPNAGEAFWFVVREDGSSYDSPGASQSGTRDAGIDASTLSCP